MSLSGYAQIREYWVGASIGPAFKYNTLKATTPSGETIFNQNQVGLQFQADYYLNKYFSGGLSFYYAPHTKLGADGDWAWVVSDQGQDGSLNMDALDWALHLRASTNRYLRFSGFADIGFIYKQVRYEGLLQYGFENPASDHAFGFRAGLGTNLKITNNIQWEIFRADFEFIKDQLVFETGAIGAGADQSSNGLLELKGFLNISTSIRVNFIRKKM